MQKKLKGYAVSIFFFLYLMLEASYTKYRLSQVLSEFDRTNERG